MPQRCVQVIYRSCHGVQYSVAWQPVSGRKMLQTISTTETSHAFPWFQICIAKTGIKYLGPRTLCKRLIRQLSCYWRLWYQQQRILVPHAISGGMLSIELSIKLMRYCAVAFLQGLQVPRRHLDISRARAHNGLLSRAICKVRRIMLENSSIMVLLINPENIALCLILQYASIV